MAFNAIDNTRVNAAKFPDDWYAAEVVAGKEIPYASIEAAKTAIPSAVRMKGRAFLVTINGITQEYWWKDDLIEPIPKRGDKNYTSLDSLGVKGDGTTDYTDIINTAINDLAVLGGGTLFAPVGTYICRTITLLVGVQIIGENKRKTEFKLKSGYTGDLFNCYNYTRGGLTNFTCNGNRSGGASGSAIHIAADLDNTGAKSTASVIENLFIGDFTKNGIEAIAVAWIFVVRNNYIQFCDGHGIYNTTTDNGFYNNDISNCGKNGFYNFGGANTRITGGKIISCGKSGTDATFAGVYFESSNRCIITSVECQDNYYSGFYISNSEQNSFIGVLSDGNNAHSRPGATTSTGTTTWATGNGYGFDLYRCKQSLFYGLATNYSISTPSQTAGSRIVDSQNIDFQIRETNQLTTSTVTNSFNIKKPDPDLNPNNFTASALLTWTADQANIKVGGSGAGAANGLEIIGVASAKLAKFNQDRSTLTGSLALDLAAGLIIANSNNIAASVQLNFFTDRARIRLSGTGAGAGNGFSIQAAGNTELWGVDGNGKASSPKLAITNPVNGVVADLMLIWDATSKEVKTARQLTTDDYRFKYTVKTGSTSITPGFANEFIEANTTAAQTQTLAVDATTTVGTIKVFKNNGTFPLTITPASGVLIESGTSSIQLPYFGDTLWILASSANTWRIINKSSLISNRGLSRVLTTTSSILATEYGANGQLTIYADASGGPFTITLPLAATDQGLTTKIVKTDASANTITVRGNGTELINNANTDTTLSTQNASFILESNGTKHFKF